MFLALLIVPVVTISHLGGWNAMMADLPHEAFHYFDAWQGLSVISIISLLAWGLGYFGQPHILVRFMAAKTPHVIPQARFICMTWMILGLYGAIATGIAGHTWVINQGQELKQAENIFILLAEQLFNPWVAGILIAAVLSAIMSTISAQLLVSASALSEDIYRAFFRRRASPKELLWTARLAVITVALVALGIAWLHNNTILQLVSYAWAGFGASFGPIILLSLYWKRMTLSGAIAGVIVGAITVIVWTMLGEHIGGFFKLYSMIPGFLFNLITVYGVSKLGSQPKVTIIDQFKQFESKLLD